MQSHSHSAPKDGESIVEPLGSWQRLLSFHSVWKALLGSWSLAYFAPAFTMEGGQLVTVDHENRVGIIIFLRPPFALARGQLHFFFRCVGWIHFSFANRIELHKRLQFEREFPSLPCDLGWRDITVRTAGFVTLRIPRE